METLCQYYDFTISVRAGFSVVQGENLLANRSYRISSPKYNACPDDYVKKPKWPRNPASDYHNFACTTCEAENKPSGSVNQ